MRLLKIITAYALLYVGTQQAYCFDFYNYTDDLVWLNFNFSDVGWKEESGVGNVGIPRNGKIVNIPDDPYVSPPVPDPELDPGVKPFVFNYEDHCLKAFEIHAKSTKDPSHQPNDELIHYDFGCGTANAPNNSNTCPIGVTCITAASPIALIVPAAPGDNNRNFVWTIPSHNLPRYYDCKLAPTKFGDRKLCTSLKALSCS